LFSYHTLFEKMKIRFLILLTLSVFFAGVLHAADLKVFAAASLTDVLQELAPAYEAQSHDKLIFNFAGSSALSRQIREGAPADLFLSADEIQMDLLAKAALIDPSTRLDLLSNLLVIVVPLDGPSGLTPGDLGNPSIRRIALADPKSVPAGVYAREYLTKLGIWKEIEPKVVPTENVRAALAAVESGNVEAGIVYKTDASLSQKVKTAYEVPRGEGPKITYPAALITSSPNAAAAKKFLLYLQSPQVSAIVRKYGFLTPGK
jgi:molybdate transport system substrate-binding protein